MAERLPWVPYYPAKLLGALAGMTTDQQLIYQVVLLRIYETWGPCPDTLEALARRCGMNRRRATDALDALFRAGKLHRQGSGIMNPFAVGVMAEAEAFRESRQSAGQKGAARRWQKDKEKQKTPDGTANARAMANDSHLHLQEESLFPEVGNNGAVAPPDPVYADSKHELWGEGVPILVQLGLKDKAARAMIGRWLRDTGDDALTVLAAIQRARENRVVEAIPWITRAIAVSRKGAGNDRQDRSTSAAAERLHDNVANGAGNLVPRPTAPSLLLRPGGVHVRQLPPGRREQP